MSLVPVNTERALVPVRPDEIERSSSPTEDERHWTEKVSEGIMVGAEWISWGLGKGAQITSRLVEKVCCVCSLLYSRVSDIRYHFIRN